MRIVTVPEPASHVALSLFCAHHISPPSLRPTPPLSRLAARAEQKAERKLISPIGIFGGYCLVRSSVLVVHTTAARDIIHNITMRQGVGVQGTTKSWCMVC